MLSLWWLVPAVLGGALTGVPASYADEIAQWIRQGGGLSGGR